MKRGKKPDKDIDIMIIEVIKKYKQAYPEFLRREINKTYKRLISWNTLEKHLKDLKERGLMEEIILNKNKRKISIYKLIV